jgi:hypothetical protein
MRISLLIILLLSSIQAYAFEKYLCENTKSPVSVEFILPTQSDSYNESQIVCSGGVGDEPECKVWSYIREVKKASLKFLNHTLGFDLKIAVERIKNGVYPDLEDKMHFRGSGTFLLDKQYNFFISNIDEDYVLFISPLKEEKYTLLRCKLASL